MNPAIAGLGKNSSTVTANYLDVLFDLVAFFEIVDMSVGLLEPSQLQPISGIRLATASAGIRYQGRDDMALIEIAPSANVAAIFTQNKFRAAPVNLAAEHLTETTPRYLLINAGNANAGTGKAGMYAAVQSTKNLAIAAKVSKEQVLPFSTGVIGEILDEEKISGQIPHLLNNLAENHWLAAARAIMTTDTVPKGISKSIDIEGQSINISGIAKGSGMIRPNMATMLAYIASDIGMSNTALQKLLEHCAEQSFNAITVDGDTSTNDACVLIATGKSKIQYEELAEKDKNRVDEAVLQVMQFLAHAIVRDGEGASKFVHVHVSNAATLAQAKAVAFTVAHSPLVKTALAASDPNWGRIMAAVGYTHDNDLQLSQVSLTINDVEVWRQGDLAPGYSEEAGKAAMIAEEIVIEISLGLGSVEKSVWTTDLTHEYVRINAEYRT